MSDTGFWIFQLPNMLLAIAIYTLLGRYVLSLFFKPDSPLVFWTVFRQVTDPLIGAAEVITPKLVPRPLVCLLAVIWLILARIALFLLIRSLGLLPVVTG